MSAIKPVIKVSKLSEVTGKNQLTKILDERKTKDGEIIFPVKLLNFEDGETFDVTLTTKPENVNIGDVVEVDNVIIGNFPQLQKFGKNDYAISNWQYTGERISSVDKSIKANNPGVQNARTDK